MAGRIAVIGGGAAGMMAAITAAASGGAVTLLERGNTLGKKILSTGNGRCNLSNRRMEEACFHSLTPEAVAEVLGAFGLPETLAFFRGLGIHVSDRNGYLYPRSEQAAAVREALAEAAKDAGVEILTEEKVLSLARKPDGFHLVTSGGKRLHTASVILTTGGMAAPKTGSDGNGYALAEALGHRICPPMPALVPLVLSEKNLCREWKGTRAKGRIAIVTDGRLTAEDTGELQLTEYGVSGIPTFQVSRQGALALSRREKVLARISFLPEFSPEEQQDLLREFSRCGRPVKAFLCGLLPARLAAALLRLCEIPETMPCYALKGNQKKKLFAAMTCLELPVTGTLPFDAAQTTAGGVDLREVRVPDMESNLVPGLYFAGEILDVDGICGGYNLQWAWSTGALAGTAAAGKTGRRRQRK